MPLYDYRCSECGHEVEVRHAIGGSGPERCEVCGGAMRKALSRPAIHFKGSGWAKKDAATSARKASTTAGTSKDGEKGSSAGGDGAAAKPEPGAKAEPAATSAESASKAGAGSSPA